MSGPPTDYVCRICRIPGHWIQQCPKFVHKTERSSYTSLRSTGQNYKYICRKCHQPGHTVKYCKASPPSNYICKICNKPGHWIQHCTSRTCHICDISGHSSESCPARNVLKLAQLNDKQMMEVAKKFCMTEQGIQKWIKICTTQQWLRIKKIDEALDRYYKWFRIYDYKNKDGIGKFLQFFQENNFKPHELGPKLIGPTISYDTCIYIGWDDYFPFDLNIDNITRRHAMYEVIKYCHNTGSSPARDMRPIHRAIGLAKHKTFHILSADYCVNDNGNDLDCKYCRNAALYHEYLATGYVQGYVQQFVPKCIAELIVLFFDVNSVRFQKIRDRNDYLLSYWRRHGVCNGKCIIIYQDGSVYLHCQNRFVLNGNAFFPEKQYKQLTEGEILQLEDLLEQYSRNNEEIDRKLCIDDFYVYASALYQYKVNGNYERLLHCKIDGAMRYYAGDIRFNNETNKNRKLWMFLNKVCKGIVGMDGDNFKMTIDQDCTTNIEW